MDAFKILSMPFQVGSLLFVALSSLVLGLLVGSRNIVILLFGLWALWVTLTWLTNYAVRMIDDIADGVRKAAAAEVEQANAVADPRAWVHPLLGVLLLVLHATRPGLPVAPTVIAAVLLFPPSLAASAISGRALDSLNPRAVFEVMRGFGPWYPLAVLATAFWAALGALTVRLLQPGWLYFAVMELLLLLTYASIGGIVYQRRFELGFEARHSPERRDETERQERGKRRQQLLDHLFESLRAKDVSRAIDAASHWLRNADSYQFAQDAQAMLSAGRQWNEPAQYRQFVLGLMPLLLERQQPALALAAAEALRAAGGRFVPGDEASTVALADFALRTGRRRTAQAMVEDFLASPAGAGRAGPRLAQLCATLGVASQPSA